MRAPDQRERWRRARLLRDLYSPEQRAAEDAALAAQIAALVEAGQVTRCPRYGAVDSALFAVFGVPRHENA